MNAVLPVVLWFLLGVVVLAIVAWFVVRPMLFGP
ncbi:MAG: hypothetical protein ACI8U4_001226 [Natronomonas sp.]|jgi:hypothetical protein